MLSEEAQLLHFCEHFLKSTYDRPGEVLSFWARSNRTYVCKAVTGWFYNRAMRNIHERIVLGPDKLALFAACRLQDSKIPTQLHPQQKLSWFESC